MNDDLIKYIATIKTPCNCSPYLHNLIVENKRLNTLLQELQDKIKILTERYKTISLECEVAMTDLEDINFETYNTSKKQKRLSFG